MSCPQRNLALVAVVPRNVYIVQSRKNPPKFAMKVKGNGQAKVLTAAELERLFKEGLTSKRDRALFAICLFTGCRISEALALETTDVKNQTITFRKSCRPPPA